MAETAGGWYASTTRAFSRSCSTVWATCRFPLTFTKSSRIRPYQTVYAKAEGSAAAPTAGLHFTPELLDRIRAKGVTIVPVLLHVGLGTFRPVKEEDVDAHVMHSEFYQVTAQAADTLNRIRQSGGRLICVGTTSVRTIETVADDAGVIHAGSGDTAIFIKPGVKIKAVDALITNFHLPQSTLLMLVSTFMGRKTRWLPTTRPLRSSTGFSPSATPCSLSKDAGRGAALSPRSRVIVP